jgi:hypothetical protein
MTLSQLDEPLRSKIVHMTADVSYWFVTYRSDVSSTATYFSSYEAATSFRGIVEHSVNGSNTITWSDARLPDYMHAEPTIRYVCDRTVTKLVSYCMMLHTQLPQCVTLVWLFPHFQKDYNSQCVI